MTRPIRTISIVPPAAALFALVTIAATLTASPALAGPHNYAECVIAKLNPDVAAPQVLMITSACRKQFPKPSSPGWFGPSSTWQCYKKHEKRVSNRRAAEALYGACADYFRKGASGS